MASFSFLFPILTLLFLISCQVKEGASSGGLIAGHVPTTNKFTIQTPLTKTFVEAETLSLTVSFPFPIVMDTTGGSPRLRLTVGAATRYATFLSQPQPTQMTFTYVIAAGDNDTNGVDVAALELNGSTLTFDKDGVPTNCDITTLTNKNVPNLKVDTAAPTVTDFDLMNLPGLYNEGERLNFNMTFSEAVTVVGSPKFSFTLSGNTVEAVYTAGSGSNVLTFAYIVGATDADSNGYDAIISPIDLAGGSIKDAVGNDSSLDFSTLVLPVITYSNNVDINGSYPFVTNVILPANGTYVAADELDFVLEFDRAVNVSGIPYLSVVIGSNTRQAQYLSGSGTEQITFRYTAVPGDVDADGISVTGSIAQNSGDIIDATPGASFFADAQNNSIVIPNTTGIKLNAIQPQATSVARNVDSTIPVWGSTSADNIWIIGQELNITVGFNTGMFVTQTGGTPTIELTIGATARQATYLSGGNGQSSLVFRYVIQEGDLDSDGTIALGNISLNGGVITDSANTNTFLNLPVAGLSTTRIDGVRPVISSVSKPTDKTYSTVSGNNHLNMTFTVNWSEAVHYSSSANNDAYIPIVVGASNERLQVSSTSNDTTGIIHHISTTDGGLSGLNDTDGVTVSSPLTLGTGVNIRDNAGNTAAVFTFTPPTTTGVLVDTIAPKVISVTPITTAGMYNKDDVISFTVEFDESVIVKAAGSRPSMPLTVGTTGRTIFPTADGTGKFHTFSYTIPNNEEDYDGVVVGMTISSNATGYARDLGQNVATSSLVSNTSTSINVDSRVPTISSTTVKVNGNTITAPYGTWEVGDVVTVTVNYSEIMQVTGTPRLALSIGGNTRHLNYVTAPDSANLVFTYTLASDFDVDGLSTISSIDLFGGSTINDRGGNTTATNNIPSPVDLSSMRVMVAGVRLWVQKEFVSLARTGSPAVSNSGVVSTVACGSSQCREFDSNDSLTLGGTINDVNTVFIVLRLAADPGTNHNIFGPDVVLKSGVNYDLLTLAAASVSVDNASINSIDGGYYHIWNKFPDGAATAYVVEVTLDANKNIAPTTLIPATFDGYIGEVIAVTGTPSPGDLTTIRTYLTDKY